MLALHVRQTALNQSETDTGERMKSWSTVARVFCLKIPQIHPAESVADSTANAIVPGVPESGGCGECSSLS